MAGDLIAKCTPEARLWVSKPTWSNHFNIFRAAGFAEINEYPYYDAEGKCLAFEPMLEALEQIPKGDIILVGIYTKAVNVAGKTFNAVGSYDIFVHKVTPLL